MQTHFRYNKSRTVLWLPPKQYKKQNLLPPQEVLPSIRQILWAWDEYLTEGMTPEECQTLEKLLERVKDRAAAWRKDEVDV